MLSKTDLSYHYPDMEMVFVSILGVPRMNLDIAYEELQKKGASDSTTIEEMKAELWQFNSLLLDSQSKPDPGPILQSRVFPVRYPDGSVQLVSAASTDFAVINYKYLEERFRGVAKMLDFNLNEVHRFRRFLKWASLDERNLSKKVSQEFITITEFKAAENEKVQELQRSLESRTHALCRLVNSFL